jgi:hypothetical protein
MHHDCADRDFAYFEGALGGGEGFLHPEFVGGRYGMSRNRIRHGHEIDEILAGARVAPKGESRREVAAPLKRCPDTKRWNHVIADSARRARTLEGPGAKAVGPSGSLSSERRKARGERPEPSADRTGLREGLS